MRRDTRRPNSALRASPNPTIIAAPRHQSVILFAARLASRSSRYNRRWAARRCPTAGRFIWPELRRFYQGNLDRDKQRRSPPPRALLRRCLAGRLAPAPQGGLLLTGQAKLRLGTRRSERATDPSLLGLVPSVFQRSVRRASWHVRMGATRLRPTGGQSVRPRRMDPNISRSAQVSA